jgi:hypothetical protein
MRVAALGRRLCVHLLADGRARLAVAQSDLTLVLRRVKGNAVVLEDDGKVGLVAPSLLSSAPLSESVAWLSGGSGSLS